MFSQMFTIAFGEGAIEDLEIFSELEQKQIVTAIELQLSLDAACETADRQRLHPSALAEWELRIGTVRVFYDIEGQNTSVKIGSIGRTFFGRKFPPDDFTEEIEFTRATQALVMLLKARARQPASVSLHELKKQLGLASMAAPS